MSGIANCPACGVGLSPRDRFCPSCGERTAASADAAPTVVGAPETQTTCLSCGNPLVGSANFCERCGASRGDDATVPSQGSLERITTDRLTKATAGEFDILERLGYGAMGSVYLARDIALSRRVAIKVISPHLLEDEAVIARFRLEAQTVAALRHPGIVNLYGVRQFGDLHYFIMDFIDGPSLRALMKAHAPLDIPVAQALLFQVAGALNYAHHRGRGVIHRDIKPANVMVDREGHAVVMDFGISRVGEGRSGLTQTGATIGTPEYMSPEQCMDQELTGASDQYSLGIVAYEMLTGSTPFSGSTYSIMMSHASSPPPPITSRRPDCPAEVEAAVMRMLAKSPAERFSDLGAAATALGGRPLGPSDPVRSRIAELAEAVSSDPKALDESSPLSPVPGAPERATLTIMGLPDVVEPGDRFPLEVESRQGTGGARKASDVVWSSSDPAVADVAEGIVSAVAPGSVSITATVGAVASTVILSVRERRSATVSLRPQTVLIEAGGSMRLQAEVLDRKGDPLPAQVVWGTEDASIATVDQNGSVTAVRPGATRIVADAGGVTAGAEIEVQQAAVYEVSIQDAPRTIHVGDDISLTVVVTDSSGAVLERPVDWLSEHPKVVAARDGRLVGVATGTATVRAECAGRFDSLELTVELAPVASVVITGAPEACGPGDRFTLQAVLRDREGTALIRPVSWESSAPDIASISGAGEVHVEGEGSVSIVARAEGVSASETMKVSGPAIAVAAAAGTTSEQTHALHGQEQAAAAPRRRLDRAWAPWIGFAAFVVVGVGLAQLFGGRGEAPAGSSVEAPVSGGAEAATDGGNEQAEPAGLEGAGQGVETVTPDPSLETADAGSETGADITPSGAGVRSPDAGPVSSSEPSVSPPPAIDVRVTSVRIEADGDELAAGETLSLTATARTAAGEVVSSPTIVWRSTDQAVATVNDGMVLGRAPGTVAIVASVDGVEAIQDLTVSAPAASGEPPTREEALREVQRFVTFLRTANAQAVARLLGGRGARAGRGGDLIERMREANFSARLTRLGDASLAGNGAAVDFDVELSWRNARGAQTRRPVTLVAGLQPTADGWELAGVRRPPGN